MVLVWVVGGFLLCVAGFASTMLPRLRARRRARRTAWSTARAAIASATISRDAASERVPEAEHLLTRAEFLVADGGGGPDRARSAARYAHRADQLWQAAADD